MIIDMPFGEWVPDRPDFKNAVAVADGVVPLTGSYGPLASHVATGVTLPSGVVIGALRTDRLDGTPVLYCGTSTDLYTIVGTVVTASGLGLSLGVGARWSFERYNNFIFATAGDVLYYAATVEIAAAFAASPGSPPRVRSIARVQDFLFTGNATLDIDATAAPNRLRWSQFNNPVGTWGDDIATQSGSVDLDPSLGSITSISGGRYGIVCQQDGVSRVAYTGGNVVFSKELIDEQHGCIAPASLVRIGGMTFGMGRSGFWQCNGASLSLISAGRVWDWFLANSDASQVSQTQGAIDWVNRCIWWNFFTPSATQKNRQLIWSWEQNRWTAARVRADWLFSTARSGIDVDAASLAGVFTDNLNLLVDDAQFAPGNRVFGGFAGINVMAATGSPQEAVIETGELQPEPSRRSMVQGIIPIVEGSTSGVLASVGVRPRLPSETVQYSTETTPSSQGLCPQRKDGRYVRARVRIGAGSQWNKISGIQVQFVPGGAV